MFNFLFERNRWTRSDYALSLQVMTAQREESIRGSLSVGLLSDALPLSSVDSLFYAVFVIDSDSGWPQPPRFFALLICPSQTAAC
jgi:hypothetical protein